MKAKNPELVQNLIKKSEKNIVEKFQQILSKNDIKVLRDYFFLPV